MNRDDLDIFSCDFIRLSNQILKIPVTCDDESVIKLLRSENGRRKKRLSWKEIVSELYTDTAVSV